MKKINQLIQLLRDNVQARSDPAGPTVRLDASTDGEAHIYVYDVIDPYWGASASGLIAALAGAGDRAVHLHINSPGGDAFEAVAMKAAIVAHPTPVAGHIEGVAASAATNLALACATCDVLEGSLFMIHNSWTFAMGDKTDLRSTAALLEKVDASLATTYAKATGSTPEQVTAWMEAETWFTAEETVTEGFCSAVLPASQREPVTAQAKAAAWNLSAYKNAPKVDPAADAAATAAAVATQLQANRNRLRLAAQI